MKNIKLNNSKYIKKYNKSYSGFTLMEMLIIMAIIGILLLIAVPNATGYLELAKKTKLQNDFVNMNTAVKSAALSYNDVLGDAPIIHNNHGEPGSYYNNTVETTAVGAWELNTDYLGFFVHFADFVPEDTYVNFNARQTVGWLLARYYNYSYAIITATSYSGTTPEGWDSDDLIYNLPGYTGGNNDYELGNFLHPDGIPEYPEEEGAIGDYSTGDALKVQHAGVGREPQETDYNGDKVYPIYLSGEYYELTYPFKDEYPSTFSIRLIFDPGTKDLKHVILANEGYISVDGGEMVLHPQFE